MGELLTQLIYVSTKNCSFLFAAIHQLYLLDSQMCICWLFLIMQNVLLVFLGVNFFYF